MEGAMTPEEREYDEWLDGFANPPLTNVEVEAIRATASEQGNREVRRLAEEVAALRHILNQLIFCVDQMENCKSQEERAGWAHGAVLTLARFLMDARKDQS